MQAIILVGGQGTRMGGDDLPKPMIRIGNRPILWHIMKHYDTSGYKSFVLCLGHRGEVVKDYFINYSAQARNVVLDTKFRIAYFEDEVEDWRIKLIETGENTNTGGRINRAKRYITANEDFLVTYGDSLSDVPINKVVEYHKKMGLTATMCVMHSQQRFGCAEVHDGLVTCFEEKPTSAEWINGGFYVFKSRVFDRLTNDSSLEYGLLSELANEGQLAAYEHTGCHRAMDTPRDVKALNEEWETGNACWKTW